MPSDRSCDRQPSFFISCSYLATAITLTTEGSRFVIPRLTSSVAQNSLAPVRIKGPPEQRSARLRPPASHQVLPNNILRHTTIRSRVATMTATRLGITANSQMRKFVELVSKRSHKI